MNRVLDGLSLSLLNAADEIDAEKAPTGADYEAYRNDGLGYAEDVLGVTLWEKQREIVEALQTHDRVMVRAGQGVGKTMCAGVVVNWWYDTRAPGIALTTAPTSRQVHRLLWKEVRVQRDGRDMPPKASFISDAADHYAVGYTARDVNAFQGTHEEDLLIVFDEAVGVEEQFWEGADAMLTSGDGNKLLAIYNPTDATSAAFAHEDTDDIALITISVLDHPNIQAELAGLPVPYPKATRLSWVEERIKRWTSPIGPGDAKATDIEWPPGSGLWYRPGPLFESRVTALWPSQPIGSVWAEAAFRHATTTRLPLPLYVPYEIGCDVARFGDDNTAIHVRRGPCSVHHESHNGWSTVQTTARLKQLARFYGRECGVDGKAINVKVDDTGVGGGVTDARDDFAFRPINSSTRAIQSEDYPNRRSELWFTVAGRALSMDLDLTRLDSWTRMELRRQCMAPRWKPNSKSQRVVEPKDVTKKRINRSPDDADAMNLAYAGFNPPLLMTSEVTVSTSDEYSIVDSYGSKRRPTSMVGGRRGVSMVQDRRRAGTR